ncbi:unnamed protein product [Phytomonas sp. Hart1]|nr:unnamed protein product [Phytomonas sp. Hart1]|eukprot:CCW70639.1 unnamed protein product [Phytomonas sp. isolate Hart1]
MFWKASRPTLLYAGPLGEVVGEVDAGTVILERGRYRDPFNGWWLSTATVEDGTLAWVSFDRLSREPNLGEVGPAWLPVKDDRPVSSELQSSTRGPQSVEDLSCEERGGACEDSVDIAELMRLAMGQVESVWSDVELIDYYWDALVVPNDDITQHWNHRYQEAVEAFLYDPSDMKFCRKSILLVELEEKWGSPRDRLERLLLEFHEAVENIAVEFVRDTQRPLESRCLRQHPTHINVFYYEDLCIRVCTDTSESYYGGEANAHKAGKNTFRSYEYLSLGVALSNCLLSVSLHALADFGGYRLLVSAIPPLTSTDCVYAPLQGSTCAESVELLSTLSKRLATSLNLSSHGVQIQAQHGNDSVVSTNVPQLNSGIYTSIVLPVDIALYAGKDRRLYLLNGSNVLPCSAPFSLFESREVISSSPLSKKSHPGCAASGLRHVAAPRLRAELLLRCPHPINPDWFVEGAHTEQDVERLRELSDFVQTDGLTTVAGILGLMLPVGFPSLPLRECRLCGGGLGNELRFLVCRHEDRCCYICTHCYTARMFARLDNLNKRKEALASLSRKGKHRHRSLYPIVDPVNFTDAVRCGGAARGADALELEPSIASLMHANGLNLRYLGFVYHRLPQAFRPVMGPYLEVEMVSRAAKKLLSARLRKALTPQSAHAVVEEFFIMLLSPNGDSVERFWNEELGPQIGRLFPGVVSPFSTASLSIELLLERLGQLSGVVFSKESLASLFRLCSTEAEKSEGEVVSPISQAKPFIELKAINPCVKVYRLPMQRLSEDREKARAAISSVLERLLVFWIGYTPNGSDERLQPNYLTKLDLDYTG